MKTYSLFLFSLLPFILIAQNARKLDSGITKDPEALLIATQKKGAKTGNTDLSESDTGAQRPISLKQGDMSLFLGYSTDLYYSSNPMALQDASKVKSGVWTNTFFAGAGLGIFDMGSYILTPYIGGSWKQTEHTSVLVDVSAADEGFVERANFNSTNSYVLLLAQFENGWSLSGSIVYSMDRNTYFEEETLKDFSYRLKTLKAFQIDQSTTFIFDASVVLHDSTTDPESKADYAGFDELDRLNLSTSFAIQKQIGPIEVSPKYILSFNDYKNGANKNREQFSHSFSLKLGYDITESLGVESFSTYTLNDSTGSDNNDDYEMLDLGAGIRLTARF